jgi:leucyl-tRNA synthetase
LYRKPKKLTIYVNDKFPSWQSKYIDLLREMMDPVSKSVDEKQLLARIGKMGEAKKAMPLVQGLRKRLAAGEDALNRTLPFDERKVILQVRRSTRMRATHA